MDVPDPKRKLYFLMMIRQGTFRNFSKAIFKASKKERNQQWTCYYQLLKTNILKLDLNCDLQVVHLRENSGAFLNRERS